MLNVGNEYSIDGYTVTIVAMVPGKIGYDSVRNDNGRRTRHVATTERFCDLVRNAKCVGCRIQNCEIEGNTATPCTCTVRRD